jgi:hypothetical protein
MNTLNSFLLLLVVFLGSCRKENVSQKIMDCSAYHQFKNEEEFFNSKNGFVDFILLEIKNLNSNKIQKLKLQMNGKPQLRVQTLSLEDQENLPEEWRNLAGLSPSEVQSYFSKNHSILSKLMSFQEHKGFGGKTIVWNSATGIEKCTQN